MANKGQRGVTPWNDEKDALLRKLYDDGVPVAEISKRLGVSASAVTGRVYRLRMFRAFGNLKGGRKPSKADAPPRPIKQNFDIKRKRPTEALDSERQRTAPVNPEPRRALSADAIKQLIVQANKMPQTQFVNKSRPCLFTSGHRGAWHFCDQLAAVDSNFCEEHRITCKVKVKPKYA